jgi:hypothetical protein
VCKSEEEIADWMIYKYIITLTNEAKFIQHKFGEEKIKRESEITWYALNYNSRSDFVKMITRSELVLSDSIYAVGGLMTELQKAFFVEQDANRLLPYLNSF